MESSLAQDIPSVGSLAGKVQAVLAVWSACLGGVAVAGVDPAEEEGAKEGSAGGAFAWREAEESGKTRKPGGSGMLSERPEAGAAGLFSSVLGRGYSVVVHRYDHTRPTGNQPWLLRFFLPLTYDMAARLLCYWNLLSIYFFSLRNVSIDCSIS